MLHDGPVTRLLSAINKGDSAARERLWSLIYNQLRTMAEKQVADEAPAHRRQATSLVHELYLRLASDDDPGWTCGRQLFAICAEAMRRIRVDDARKRGCAKRGSGRAPAPLINDEATLENDPLEILTIDEALEKFKQEEPEKAEVVLLRYFAGLSVDECASVMKISPRTVDNWWRFARAWFYRHLSGA